MDIEVNLFTTVAILAAVVIVVDVLAFAGVYLNQWNFMIKVITLIAVRIAENPPTKRQTSRSRSVILGASFSKDSAITLSFMRDFLNTNACLLDLLNRVLNFWRYHDSSAELHFQAWLPAFPF